MTTSLFAFIPPHCPRKHCRYHRPNAAWRWKRFGSFTRQCEPQVIPRFRCLHCLSTFSTQTFSTTYYLKRPDLLEAIAHRLLACSGYRQIAREARCNPTSVMGQAARIGRHALLLLHALKPSGELTEALVIDGFESFAYSQYHPLHLNPAVGARSHFTYAFTFARLRRKGSMTDRQRNRRTQIEVTHGRADPKAIEMSVADLLDISTEAKSFTVRSDEHPAYPRAIRRLHNRNVAHEQTPSVAARTPHNPLFPVNLMDLLLRHNGANHKRETIAFSKRHQSVIERAAWLFIWRNFAKHFSERRREGSPAMQLGLTDTMWSVAKLLDGRRFVTHLQLPASWQDYYWRKIDTPGIANPRRHNLKLAW